MVRYDILVREQRSVKTFLISLCCSLLPAEIHLER